MFFNLRRLLHDFRIYQKKWFLSNASDKLPKRLGVASCVSLIMYISVPVNHTSKTVKNSRKKLLLKASYIHRLAFYFFFFAAVSAWYIKKAFGEKKQEKSNIKVKNMILN